MLTKSCGTSVYHQPLKTKGMMLLLKGDASEGTMDLLDNWMVGHVGKKQQTN